MCIYIYDKILSKKMKILKKIDYFSTPITFSYQGSKKFSTILGGILTIASVTIILFFSWLLGKDIYQRQSPTIISIDEAVFPYPNFTMNYNNSFIAFNFE